MNKISLEHVDKVYDKGVQVIEDLNLDIREGSFTILLGPPVPESSTLPDSLPPLSDSWEAFR